MIDKPVTTIDLRKLRVGNTVKFRCGGKAVVKKTQRCKTDSLKRKWIIFEGSKQACAFLMDGGAGFDGSISIFDIVKVVK